VAPWPNCCAVPQYVVFAEERSHNHPANFSVPVVRSNQWTYTLSVQLGSFSRDSHYRVISSIENIVLFSFI